MAEIIKDKILIVDDEPQVRELLTLNFRDEYLVSTAATVKEASAKIQNEKFSLVITDMNMAGEKGRDVIHLVKTVSPETIVLAITGYGSVEDAVNAVKLGAEEYFLKPLDLERFNLTVKNHMEKFHLNRQLNKNSRLLELEKASRAVLEAEVIEVSLPDILKMILGMFKADSGSVMLFDKNSEQLVVSASEGLSNLAQESLRVSDGAKISGWAAKHNRPLLLGPDPEKSKKILGDFEPRNEINSSLVVPLAIRGKPLGVLNLNMLSDVK
ncbi:MAG: response regulator, partial [Candidatus Firestonebacteria bacterium]